MQIGVIGSWEENLDKEIFNPPNGRSVTVGKHCHQD